MSEKPHPRHVGSRGLLRMIVGETAGLEDDGAQLGDVLQQESLKCISGRPGRGIASCSSAIAGARGRRCFGSMQKSADQADPPFPSRRKPVEIAGERLARWTDLYQCRRRGAGAADARHNEVPYLTRSSMMDVDLLPDRQS